MHLDFDIGLLAAASAVAAAAIAWIVLRTWASTMSLDFRIVLTLATVAGLTILAGHAWVGPNPLEHLVSSGPQQVPANGYVTSDTCAACHPGRYDTWHDTYHRTMTQLPGPDTVRGPFDTTLTLDGQDYRLYREGDRFLVDMPRPEWAKSKTDSPRITRPISLLTGSHHYQVYWLSTGSSHMLAQLPFVYLIEDQAWFPRRDVFMTPPDYVHSDEYGRWNYTCIRCHATGGRPRPWMGLTSMADTQVSEFGIACEACHGPAREHIERMRNPLSRYRLNLDPGRPPAPGVVNPARLDGHRNPEVCGQCHSINGPRGDEMDAWLADGLHFRPGDKLEDTRIVFDAESLHEFSGYFWKDGMVRVAGREFSALKASPCYADDDFTCLSCHAVHQRADDPRPREEWRSGLLRGDRDTDETCVGCHARYSEPEARATHTHHTPGSAGDACVSCHMPFTSYGLGKAIRSHQIGSPSLDDELVAGRPNACVSCHVTETLPWASRHLSDWYGQPAPQRLADHDVIPAAIRSLHQGDAAQRALAAWHLGHAAESAMADADWARAHLLLALDDPYRVVRLVAFRAIRKTLPAEQRQMIDANWLQDAPELIRSRITALAAPGDTGLPANVIARLRATRDERDIVISE